MGAVEIFLLLMVPGTFLLGVNDVLVRRMLREGKINEQLFLGLEFFAVGLLMIIPLLFVGIPELKPGFWGAALTTAVLNVFGQWAWYAAFKRESASLVAPLRLLTPPLVILTGYLILRETPTAGGILGIFVTIAGLWFLIRSEADIAEIKFSEIMRRPGVILGLLGALSFAVSLPFDKKAVVSSSAVFMIFVVGLVLGGLSILLALIREGGTFRFDIKKNLHLFSGIIIVHAVATYLTAAALNFALVAYAASVKRLWSLWTVLLSGKFLEEKNIGKKLIATLVMLLGIAVTLFLG